MVALVKGTKAPPFDLLAIDGRRHNLQLAASSTSSVLLAFFKVNCPTCQYAMPYVERLHQRYPSLNIWGISQDDLTASQTFAKQYGLSLPILLDSDLSVTAKYDLTNVPTVFLVDKNLSVNSTIVGFVRDDFEQVNKELAKAASQTPSALFYPADDVVALKPG